MQDAIIKRKKIMEEYRTTLSKLREIGRQLAKAEADYRRGIAKEMARLHIEDGVAYTACYYLARGSEENTELYYTRKVRQVDYDASMEFLQFCKREIAIVNSDMEAIRRGE